MNNEPRQFCKPMEKSKDLFAPFIPTKTTLWERFCLLFVDKGIAEDEITGYKWIYKFWNGKMYHLKEIPPKKGYSSRHTLV